MILLYRQRPSPKFQPLLRQVLPVRLEDRVPWYTNALDPPLLGPMHQLLDYFSISAMPLRDQVGRTVDTFVVSPSGGYDEVPDEPVRLLKGLGVINRSLVVLYK